MSDNKNFFKASHELEHSQSDVIQGSLDPMGQDSLDPYIEEDEAVFAAEEPAAETVDSFLAQEAPPQPDYTESFSTSPMGAEDYSRPPISDVMSSESGAEFYQQSYAGGMTPPPTPPKKKNGILIAVIAAAVLLVGCLGVFGYFLISDRQEAVAQQEADEAEVQYVRDLIASIGAVSLGSGDVIAGARSAYDALSTDQKDLVTNYATLTSAEQTYQLLLDEEEERKAEEARIKAEEEARKSTLVTPNYTSYCGIYIVDANSGLVLRYGPSTDYYKILTMPYDSVVEVWAWSGNWAYVCYNNRWGWCSGDYLW